MKKNLIIKLKKYELFLIFFSILSLFILSAGKFYRYLLSEQLALAINLEKYGKLFNSDDILQINHFSSYFPGLSYFFFFINKVTPDLILYEVLLIISSAIIILFLFSIKKILLISFEKKIDFENYWLITIIFVLAFCKSWLFYATSFKSDTIAFTSIVSAFLILRIDLKDFKIKITSLIIATFLIIFGLSCKQQAIFLLPALFTYWIFNKNFKYTIFSLFISLLTFFLYFSFYKNKIIWFNAIEKFKYDRFYSLNEFLYIYDTQIYLIIFFIILYYAANKFGYLKLRFNSYLLLLRDGLKKNIFFHIFFFFSIASMISALKVGGNRGNSELSIILLYPFIYIFFSKFNKKKLLIISFFLIILNFKEILKNGYYYIQSKKFQIEVNNEIKNENLKILAEKSTYFTIFSLEKNNTIESFNTYLMIEKYFRNSEDSNAVLTNLLKKNYDYIILDNTHNFNFENIAKYKLVKKNKFGKLYKFNNK